MEYLKFLKHLPPLRQEVSPIGAFFVGILFGFIGLPIYLRSCQDFWVLLALWFLFTFLLAIPTGPIAPVLSWCFQGLYGYARAADSNERRQKR
ncbi:MAG TPA: hypothetical protein V6D25_29735 [Leptolyngbyaceae cyanobacterium]